MRLTLPMKRSVSVFQQVVGRKRNDRSLTGMKSSLTTSPSFSLGEILANSSGNQGETETRGNVD
jgi:hypothetical protein